MKLDLSTCYFSDDVMKMFNELQVPLMQRQEFFVSISHQAHALASKRFAGVDDIPANQIYLFDASHILMDSHCICNFTESGKLFTKNFHVSIVTKAEYEKYCLEHDVRPAEMPE